MQAAGNLCLTNGTTVIRATRTDGHPNAMVQLQDDGNFVVYEDPAGPLAGTPLWASASDPFYGPFDDAELAAMGIAVYPFGGWRDADRPCRKHPAAQAMDLPAVAP